MKSAQAQPFGHQWRSSKSFIVFTVTLALFAETFLYGFLVPILPHMLEVRLGIDPSETQSYITTLLTIHGFLSIVSAPIIGHFADKTPHRKIPLMIGLGACLIGTILIALTPNLFMLFVGRYLQAIGGSATWVVGYAMLLDCTDTKNMGKRIGLSMSFITAGIISGPAVSGVLLGLVGYWATWSVPMVILVLDIIARLLMIDSRELPSKEPNEMPSNTNTESNETTALLQNQTPKQDTEPLTPTASSPLGFYRIMLTDGRVLVALLNTIMFSAITAGFNNTLPLHLREVFGWGSMETSLMFFCLQAPSFFFSTLNGMMRDRYGVRYPAAIGWALLAPLLWLLGVPGDERFPWAGSDVGGKNIFIVVAKNMQAQNPQIFGPYGGSSRVFAIIEMCFGAGMMVGPMFTGPITEKAGYYYMTLTLAIICLVLSGLTLKYFEDTQPKKRSSSLA
ncbi:hypothetical protein N7455_008871 [Penicillium solitum]|uniref:uncharacterized protein n=1 Tax=Penicillium solitum TaxID=60172 RepID=UPI0032C48C04|nr:hypothetical protein N7455_008871 [Penicillium solitum]